MPPSKKVVLAAGLLAAALATPLPALSRIAESAPSLQPGGTKLGTAFEALKKSHESGDRRATVPYAAMLQRGLGTAADPQRAFAVAKEAADAGDAGAAIFVAESLLAGRGTRRDPGAALQAVRSLAESGNAQAQLLAYRASRAAPGSNTLTAGSDQTFGLEMLGRAAQQDLPAAKLQLAVYFVETAGVGNRERAVAILSSLERKTPLLGKLQTALGEIEQLGDSPTTIKLIQDAEFSAVARATAQGERLARDGDCEVPVPVLSAMRPGKPLTDAEFLPVDLPELATSRILRGTWSENWDYAVCGQTVTVEVQYRADGKGVVSFDTAVQ